MSKNSLDQINTEILRQFESRGLTINEGIAVDARLVKSASHPISKRKLKNFAINMILLKAGLIKTESLKSSPGILYQIGPLKTINLTTD